MRSVAVAVTTVLASGLAAVADPIPMSAGRQPSPLENTPIAIAREDLRLALKPDAVEVTADFEFANAGPAAKVTMALPCERARDERIVGLDCRQKIQVRVEGKAARVHRGPLRGELGSFLWDVEFAPGATTRLSLYYTARLENERYGVPLAGALVVFYRLRTGAAWAGPIGELNATVESPSDALVAITPAGAKRSRGRIRWELRNYEPAEDLALWFDPRANASCVESGRCVEMYQGVEQTMAMLENLRPELRRFELEPPSLQNVIATTWESVRLLEAPGP